ncbi:hypothetical protein A2685_01485 [Candidatus Woesebacteria bacterium RIFCSPHIGHO2_01_FULL_37_10]|uniref:Uncharacterized protein n=1 Tax=Candidatus Woesebacteria bacterium RIFCSPHIGHO2_01_FULL_37_10 TaxID=1802489 RepID=A0A1F7XVE5_9BACT|nr:MAG: hypothetical protein A2685_01485 [Candidatus Woesebacteria bacterium RIFCSPHIGHO2_01_FULL_37_10]
MPTKKQGARKLFFFKYLLLGTTFSLLTIYIKQDVCFIFTCTPMRGWPIAYVERESFDTGLYCIQNDKLKVVLDKFIQDSVYHSSSCVWFGNKKAEGYVFNPFVEIVGPLTKIEKFNPFLFFINSIAWTTAFYFVVWGISITRTRFVRK